MKSVSFSLAEAKEISSKKTEAPKLDLNTPSASVLSEGESRAEGEVSQAPSSSTEPEKETETEQTKRKEKGKAIEVESEPKSDQVSESEHRKLVRALHITRLKKISEGQVQSSVDPSSKLETEAKSLGLEVEVYQKHKNDPRLMEALKILAEVESRKNITPEEEELDAKCMEVTLDVYRKEREISINEEISKADDLIAKMLGELEEGPVKAKVSRKRSAQPRKPKTKKQAEAQLEDFVAIQDTPRPTPTPKPIEVRDESLQQTEAWLKFEESKRRYAQMMRHMCGKGKINDVMFHFTPGQAKFDMDVIRADGSVQNLKEVTFNVFGYTEWIELFEIISKRPDNKTNRGLLNVLKEKIGLKPKLEKYLGLDLKSKSEEQAQASGSSIEKRKTSEAEQEQSKKARQS